jgi:hypothetical protein
VIANRVEKVKTKKSKARLSLDPALVELLQTWRSISEFNKDDDWVWASPFVAGEMPYLPNAVQRDYIVPAAKQAGSDRSVGNVSAIPTGPGWTVREHLSESKRICFVMPISGRQLMSTAGHFPMQCGRPTARWSGW